MKALDELGLEQTHPGGAVAGEGGKIIQNEVEAASWTQRCRSSRATTGGTAGETMKAKMEPTRKGFGKSLANNG